MSLKDAIQATLYRTVPPKAFAFIRLRWRLLFFARQTIASWKRKLSPDVRGIGSESSALEFFETMGRVNVLARTNMCRVMLRQRSDKSYHSHNYTTLYTALFKGLLDQPLRIFELGLGSNNVAMPFNMGADGIPGASLRGWREIFPNAEIFGADIDRGSLFEEERIKTFFCDQLSRESIHELWSQPELREGMDILIEDGLHTFEGNVSFLEGSLTHLRPGGTYVIEDVDEENAERWQVLLETDLKKRFPAHLFAYVSLPTFAGVRDNNLIVIRRGAA